MHEGIKYDPIQRQGQRHKPFKVGNSAIFKGHLLSHLQWGLASDHEIPKLGHNTYSLSGPDFFLFLSEFLRHVT